MTQSRKILMQKAIIKYSTKYWNTPFIAERSDKNFMRNPALTGRVIRINLLRFLGLSVKSSVCNATTGYNFL